jgi:acyl-CoA thioesterase FadM
VSGRPPARHVIPGQVQWAETDASGRVGHLRRDTVVERRPTVICDLAGTKLSYEGKDLDKFLRKRNLV